MNTRLFPSNAFPKIFSVTQRPIFEWINVAFNAVNEDRLREFGPDRTCAEWLLRNGGKVRWKNEEEFQNNYNLLPTEGTTRYIEEIDATESCIMHYGFGHLKGCKYIKNIIFHKCTHLQDEAFPMLKYVRNSLISLQISSCGNITEKGLECLEVLHKLEKLTLFDLPYVNNMEKVVDGLRKKLPNCKITYK